MGERQCSAGVKEKTMVAMIYTMMDLLLMTLTLARTSKRSRHARNNHSNIAGPGRTPYTVFYLSPRTRP
jgi:hypothetical protein